MQKGYKALYIVIVPISPPQKKLFVIMSRIRPESDFRAFQNLVCEHSIAGLPASLYNLTKSVPDPC